MSRNQYHDYLRQVPMFAELDNHELDVVSRAATDLRFDAGDTIMRQGDIAHEMVIVTEGELEVVRDGEHVADIGPGGFAGELALLTRGQRNSSVRAKTEVSLLHIDGRLFSSLLEEVPQIAVRMLPVIAARAHENAD